MQEICLRIAKWLDGLHLLFVVCKRAEEDAWHCSKRAGKESLPGGVADSFCVSRKKLQGGSGSGAKRTQLQATLHPRTAFKGHSHSRSCGGFWSDDSNESKQCILKKLGAETVWVRVSRDLRGFARYVSSWVRMDHSPVKVHKGVSLVLGCEAS